MEVLRPKVPVQRMVFNEITPEAIREAVENPRDLNMELVEAQETRRIVDRRRHSHELGGPAPATCGRG